jgi:nucleoside-diphosphate-sugar epimerase
MILNISLFGKETVYNIGGVSKTSILELAQKISDITEKSVVTSETDSIIQGNPNVVNVSIKKYCTEFKKLSFVQLEEGLNNTINWQKNLYNNEKSQN